MQTADSSDVLPDWALPARLKSALRGWWLGRHPRTDTLRLTERNVYILPTRAGWMLTLTLLVLLIASINFQLNLGYALTFLLAGSAAAAMVVGHSTLRGLNLSLMSPQPLFAGASATVSIKLMNARRAPRYAIGLALRDTRSWIWADVAAGGQTTVQVGFVPTRRGLHPVPPITVQTRFPLGTFRVWSIWRPAARVCVYPVPEPNAPAWPPGQPQAGDGLAGSARAAGEFDGVRAYRRGDPLKRIVWKKFAKSGELVSRDTAHTQRQTLWFDYAQTGHLDPEARLSRLTAWVLAADAQALDYGLRLPGLEIAVDGGPAQRARCLRALATC